MQIVTAKSTDGIYFKGLLSEAENPKGIIIHIHGMAGTPILNSYYPNMHEQYPKNGWSFLAVEHRGTGVMTYFDSNNGGKVIGNAFEIFEDCVKDIQGWIDFAKSLNYKNIWLQSYSLGTSKAAYYLNQTSCKDINGTIFISSSDMVGLVHDKEGQIDHDKLYPEAKDLIAQGKPTKLLSNMLWGDGILSAQTYLSLFGDGTRDAIFNYSLPDLGWDVVNSISIPVLAITGTKDDGVATVMDPYKAMQLLETQLKNSPRKKTIVYENADHSFNGFEENIVKDVLDFIDY